MLNIQYFGSKFNYTITQIGNGKSRNYSYLRSAINRSTLYVKIFLFSAKVAKRLTKSKHTKRYIAKS